MATSSPIYRTQSRSAVNINTQTQLEDMTLHPGSVPNTESLRAILPQGGGSYPESPTQSISKDSDLDSLYSVSSSLAPSGVERQYTSPPDLTDSVQVVSAPVFDGTYSRVFRGFYGDIEVAVKALRPSGSLRAIRRKFRRESTTWWLLDHPNVLPLFGLIERDELSIYGCMVSQWCSNGSVSEFLFKNGGTEQFRMHLLEGAARGLEYLHSLNPAVVHGDLKLGNILVDDDFNARLCDFGLSRFTGGATGGSTGLTTTTAYMGTARYSAYEFVSDSPILPTKESDAYAMGCVILELLFQMKPFAHIQLDSRAAYLALLTEISNRRPPAKQPRNLSKTLAKLWKKLVDPCWRVIPAERPTASEISIVVLVSIDQYRISQNEPLETDLT